LVKANKPRPFALLASTPAPLDEFAPPMHGPDDEQDVVMNGTIDAPIARPSTTRTYPVTTMPNPTATLVKDAGFIIALLHTSRK
jgi:hypothetical protein